MKKRYLVVGASKGIGGAVSQKLDADGHDVIGVSRTTAQCQNWLQADVTTREGLEAIAAQLSNEKLDALLYMAGTWEETAFSENYDFLKCTQAEIQNIIALNLTAPILLAQTLANNLSQSDNPKIILMGSTSGLDQFCSTEVAYTASKFGLRGAGQSLAIALKHLNIDVSIINPGDVATPAVIQHCEQNNQSTVGLIPMIDLLRTIDLILEASSHAIPAEINLLDKR